MMPSGERVRFPTPRRLLRAVVGVSAICLAIVAPVACHRSGQHGLVAAAFASACCCVGAAGTLGLGRGLRNPSRLPAAVALGMLLRMGIPLASAVAVQLLGSPLAEAGFLYYLLLFYMVTLVVETAVLFRSWST